MRIQNLPTSLLQASKKVVETKILESCKSCGAVIGSCLHTEGQVCSEDEVTAMDIPNEEEPEEKLSGRTETVVINPEYLTFTPRRM